MSLKTPTAVICTALEPEYSAVRAHLDRELIEDEQSGTLYEIGVFPADRGRWRVVLAQTGPGNTEAAVAVERAISVFSPDIVLFVGVAAGRKDVTLGDVVASNHIYGYESGKEEEGGYRTRIKSFPCSHKLVQQAQAVARCGRWPQRVVPTVPEPAPRAYVKPLAAGSKVIASAESPTARLIGENCGDAVAVEMEGHGFLHGAHVNDRVDALVVRGISDLQSGKEESADRHWQPVAASHAAAFAFELLSRLDGRSGRRAAANSTTAAQLPRTEPHFLGRSAALDSAATVLAAGADEDRRATVLVTGIAGVGKTEFSVRLARAVLDQYPDGAVFLRADENTDLLGELLHALDPDSAELHTTSQRRQARLRSLLAERRVLLVIDNVPMEDSIIDLLEIDGPYGLVCTSRARLSGLMLSDSHSVELEPLAVEDAASLACLITEESRLAAEESARLAEICGGLPLAVRITAAWLRTRPLASVAEYLQELGDPDQGVAALAVGRGRATDMTKVLEVSYRSLSPQQAQHFHVLGLLPHTSQPAEVVAAGVADRDDHPSKSDLRATERTLDELFELNLVEQVAEGRYRLHSVLYRFARSKALAANHEWQQVALHNGALMYAGRTLRAVTSIGYADNQAREPARSNEAAISLIEADRAGLVALTEALHKAGYRDEIFTLASAATLALHHRSHWSDLARFHLCLLDVAEQAGKTEWRHYALQHLATAATHAGDTEQATALYRRCHDEALADDNLEAAYEALDSYGGLLLSVGDPERAIDVLRRSTRAWRVMGDDSRLAQTLGNLGTAHLATGRWARAGQYFRNALRVAERANAMILYPILGIGRATVLRMQGQDAEAEQECRKALERARAVGDRRSEARALTEMALCASVHAISEPATNPLAEALELYRDMEDIPGQITTLYLLGSNAASGGNPVEAAAYLQECADLARQAGDAMHGALSLAYLAVLAGAAGGEEDAQRMFREAEQCAEATQSNLVVNQVRERRARLLVVQGRFVEAVGVLRHVVRSFEPLREYSALANARVELGYALMQADRWQEAAAELGLVAESGSHVAQVSTRAAAARFLGGLYSRRELWPEALAAARRSLELAQQSGDPYETMLCHVGLGVVLARMRRWDEAREEFRHGEQYARETKDLHTLISIRANLLARQFHDGEQEQTLEDARHLIGISTRLGMSAHTAILRLNLGSFLARNGQHQPALEEFTAAHDLARQSENIGVAATAKKNSAKAHLALGQEPEAVRVAAEARQLYRSIGDTRSAAETLLIDALRYAAEQPDIDVRSALEKLTRDNHDLDPQLLSDFRQQLDELRTREHNDLTTEAHRTSTRVIRVAAPLRERLDDIDIDIDALTEQLASVRAFCLRCRLPISEDGAAELIMLVSENSQTMTAALTHPQCARSSIAVTASDPAKGHQQRTDIECIIFADGRLAGVILDCQGGLGITESGTTDLALSTLREAGFFDLSAAVDLGELPTNHAERVTANLHGNRLTLSLCDQKFLSAAPLSFYPKWYRAARNGALLVIAGRNLPGMVADDPKPLIRAIERKQAVGALIPLTVVPPSANQPCICTPPSGAKYKRCCGTA
ncbi:tetratricopeptide repeat protein [Saccharopolyspora shandongensis]|uniref:tetratricopeptide repeat protein n=1 Tax=Saccharopolyspora shandongensis TaxID=418495 RepID=UPI0033C61B87